VGSRGNGANARPVVAQWQPCSAPRAHPFLLLRPFEVLDPFFLLIIDTTNTSSILSLPPQTTRRTTPYVTRAIASVLILLPLAYFAAVAGRWSHVALALLSTRQRQSPHLHTTPPTEPIVLHFRRINRAATTPATETLPFDQQASHKRASSSRRLKQSFEARQIVRLALPLPGLYLRPARHIDRSHTHQPAPSWTQQISYHGTKEDRDQGHQR
jgi:hypothetical protein